MTAGHPGDAASPVMDPSAGKEVVGKEVVA
jgi:hypothetical protein